MDGDVIRMFNMNPRWTFESFVVAHSNHLAYEASLAVARDPGKCHNPLFIYGGQGFGATHLIHAIGNHLVKEGYCERNRVCLITGESFHASVMNSLRMEDLKNLRQYLGNLEVLMIDDIQFLRGNRRAQEELCHIFTALCDKMNQIIITCDVHPRDLEGFEEGLKPRLEGGLVVEIQPPEMETKLMIIQRWPEHEEIVVPHDVALFIADYARNVRHLKSMLVWLQAASTLSNTPISLRLVEQYLSLHDGA